MDKLIIITPVKDSIETTMQTVQSVSESVISIPHTYTIYNDLSTEENTRTLEDNTKKHHYNLVNLKDIVDTPSPNYKTTLRLAQQQAIEENAGLLIIESDVVVKADTAQQLMEKAKAFKNTGMVASVTVDENGEINFPYLYAKGKENRELKTDKRLSFCCTLLTLDFLKKLDFSKLDEKKSWYDVFISHQSVKLGFNNYLLTTVPVLHQPHSSRPWKQLKYTNPIKYYWLKYTKGLDKI
jgi:hypothetical protein